MIDNLHFVKDLGYQSQEALEAGDLHAFAELMNVHWEHKKQRCGEHEQRRHRRLVRPGAWRTARSAAS